MHLVKVTSHVGFSGEGFEADWAGLSRGCAERPWSTSRNSETIGYLTFQHSDLTPPPSDQGTGTFHHGQQAGGNGARLRELPELLQFGLVHLAAVASDAAPRVEVLTAQAAGDGHVFHLGGEKGRCEWSRGRTCWAKSAATHPAGGALIFMLRLLRFRLLLGLPPPLSPILSGAAVALRSRLLTRLAVFRTLHGLSFTGYRTLSGTKTKQEACLQLLKISRNSRRSWRLSWKSFRRIIWASTVAPVTPR